MKRSPAARWTLWIVAVLAAIPLAWLAYIAASIGWYRYYPPRETAFMAQRMDEARAKNPKVQLRYVWVS